LFFVRNMAGCVRLSTLALCIVVAGCGFRDPSMPELVSVTGTVTLDDKPLRGAIVTFLPTSEQQGGGAVGFTDADGKYNLQTVHGGAGCPRGVFRIAISKMVMPDGSDIPPGANIDEMEVGTREKLPEKYSSIELTELTGNVPQNGGTIDFKLNST
jgi:hypothetical protein